MLTYKTQIEDTWNVHCYCMAIQFYLGNYDTDDLGDDGDPFNDDDTTSEATTIQMKKKKLY